MDESVRIYIHLPQQYVQQYCFLFVYLNTHNKLELFSCLHCLLAKCCSRHGESDVNQPHVQDRTHQNLKFEISQIGLYSILWLVKTHPSTTFIHLNVIHKARQLYEIKSDPELTIYVKSSLLQNQITIFILPLEM